MSKESRWELSRVVRVQDALMWKVRSWLLSQKAEKIDLENCIGKVEEMQGEEPRIDPRPVRMERWPTMVWMMLFRMSCKGALASALSMVWLCFPELQQTFNCTSMNISSRRAKRVLSRQTLLGEWLNVRLETSVYR